MTNLEFCLAKRKAEVPTFLRVLKALPKDRLDYKPDPKSRSAAELAWVLAVEERALVTLIDKGEIEWKDEPPPASLDDIVSLYERSSAATNERLAGLDAAAWGKKVRMLMGGASAWEDTLQEFVWGFLFDAIHHRGQLSTYLRPMGGKVPSIYGPSADDPGR